MFDRDQVQQLVGRELHSTDGTRIGEIGEVYLDDEQGGPEWVTVNTGLFGGSESFVPLAEATVFEDGLVVPYSKDQIKAAPNVSPDGELDEDEERRLYRHYGASWTADGTTSGDGERRAGSGDDAMTRSEERVDVGTESVERGRARLRKWVETEQVQVDVPVRRERARVVTEPITDGNRGAALDGPEISEAEHEVTLTQERPVVSKETVPVERVRLDKDVRTHTETVEETAAKERIEFESDVEETVGGRHRRH